MADILKTNIFKCFLNEIHYMLIEISLRVVPEGPVEVNIVTGNGLVPNRQLEAIMIQFFDTNVCHNEWPGIVIFVSFVSVA